MVHRSYLDHGTIQVAVYDNRLEITSPGKLPMGQTMERMKEGYSKIRNEALAHAFAYMNLIEHWGSGIPRIIDKVKAAGLREPEFIGGEVDLRINIYRGQIDGTVDLNASNTAVKLPLNRRGRKEEYREVLLGTSVHSLEEAREAQTLGADYLTAGHIYATDCKRGLPPRGTGLRQ